VQQAIGAIRWRAVFINQVALCSLLALVSIQEVMLAFLTFIYLLSAGIVGYALYRLLRNERYVTAQEAVKYLLIVATPVLNTVIACVAFWEAIEDIVIWSRNDQA